MKTGQFIKEIFGKFPLIMVQCVFWQLAVGAVMACSLITVSPIVDLYLHPDLQGISPLTQKTLVLLEVLHLPVTFNSWVGLFMVLIIVATAIQIIARHAILKIIYAVVKDLMIGTFEDFFHARWQFFSSRKQGTLLNTFNHELNVVSNAIGAMSMFFAGLIQIVFYLAVPLMISWQVTAVSLGVGLVLSLPILLLGRFAYRWGGIKTKTANRVNEILHESLSLAKIVTGFGNQFRSTADLNKAYNEHVNVAIKAQTLNVAIPTLYRPFGIIMIIFAMIFSKSFTVPLSEMAVLVLALFQVALSLGNLFRMKNALDSFFPSYEQIKSLREEAQKLRQNLGGNDFCGFDRDIVIRNLIFSYPGYDPVLKDINIIIPKGTMTALVGKSGSGKSTLIDLIMGFHELDSGTISFDGHNLSDFDIQSYRHRIGYVPQESVLFNMTIRNNLLWAKPDATEEDIRSACRTAYADDFIEEFPEGYNTIAGDRGVRLSGGQIQRLALARALLRHPEVLILDEATSALDSHSEQLIQKALENISRQTTVIVIAHRLSTIKKADQICVLEEGKIIEQGNYNDLVESTGHFRNMVELQELQLTG